MFRGSFRATSGGGGGGGGDDISWQAISAASQQPYPMSAANNGVKVDVSAGAVSITLPAPAGVSGKIFTIKHSAGNIASNNITITATGSQIDGLASLVMTQNLSTTRVSSDGSDYIII